MSKSDSRGEPGGTPFAPVTRIPAGRCGESFTGTSADGTGKVNSASRNSTSLSAPTARAGERESFGDGLNPWLYASGRPARRKIRPHSDWISRPLRYFAGPSLE